jgi:hypothetical protein
VQDRAHERPGRRSGAGRGEAIAMARIAKALTETDLELALLRKGVGARVAGRDACTDCGRSPLVGERMYHFAGEGGSVCALCRPRRNAEPDAVELVRHFERGHTVRLVARHAA